MSSRGPANPVWLALPSAAFVTTIAGLLGHLATDEIVWYEVALVAAVVGIASTLLAIAVSFVDAENHAAGTQARDAGVRQVACEALALVLLAASATVMYTGYERHAVLVDLAPLVLGSLGAIALTVASWYGRTVIRLYRLGRAIVWYPARRVIVTPRPPHPRPTPTIG
jgi:uncharacterized membrane protein